MISQILVPLDGALLAESVLPHVVAIGRAANAQVTLLHVVETSLKGRDLFTDVLSWQLRRLEATAYLDAVASRLEQAGVSAKRTVLEGRAAQQIINYVRAQQPDLLVFSNHGENGLQSWNLSSVVQKVIQVAKTSLLLVRAHQAVTTKPVAADYRRLLVPLDGSRRAELALSLATIIAGHWDAELLLAHVVVRPQLLSCGPTSVEDEALLQQFVERNVAAAAKYLAQLQSRLPVRSQVRLRAGENILDVFENIIEEDGVDLMVCTAHGHGCHREQLYGGLVNSCLIYGSALMLVVQDLRPDEIAMTDADTASVAPLLRRNVIGHTPLRS